MTCNLVGWITWRASSLLKFAAAVSKSLLLETGLTWCNLTQSKLWKNGLVNKNRVSVWPILPAQNEPLVQIDDRNVMIYLYTVLKGLVHLNCTDRFSVAKITQWHLLVKNPTYSTFRSNHLLGNIMMSLVEWIEQSSIAEIVLMLRENNRVATNLENLEYSGISRNMENSGNSVNSVQPQGKIVKKVCLVCHSNICVKQMWTR